MRKIDRQTNNSSEISLNLVGTSYYYIDIFEAYLKTKSEKIIMCNGSSCFSPNLYILCK